MHIDTSKRANRDSSEMENDVTEKKEPKKQEEEWLDVSEIDSILERSSFANRKQGVVSHKGISAKRVSSVKEKPVGLSKPRKKQMPDVNYLPVARILKPASANNLATSTTSGLSLRFTEINTVPFKGSFVCVASCAL